MNNGDLEWKRTIVEPCCTERQTSADGRTETGNGREPLSNPVAAQISSWSYRLLLIDRCFFIQCRTYKKFRQILASKCHSMAVLNRSSSSAEEDAASAIIRSHHGADDEEEKSLTLTQTIPHHAPPYPYNPPFSIYFYVLIKTQWDSQTNRQPGRETDSQPDRKGARRITRIRKIKRRKRWTRKSSRR